MLKSNDITSIFFGIFVTFFVVTKSNADSIDATIVETFECHKGNNGELISLITSLGACESYIKTSFYPNDDYYSEVGELQTTASSYVYNTIYIKSYSADWIRYTGGTFQTREVFECLDPDYPDLWYMNGVAFCSERFRISDADLALIIAAENEANAANSSATTAVVTASSVSASADASADSSLQSAAQAAGSSTTTNSNLTIINNYQTTNPDVQSLTSLASNAQTESDSASAAAAAALAAATDAAVDALNANQALMNVKSSADTAAVAAAEAAAAHAAGLAAESQAIATAAVNSAQSAAAAAQAAINGLASALESISNSAIKAAQSFATAAGAATSAATSATNSANAAAGAAAAVNNGELCVGDSCIPVPDPTPDKETDEDGDLDGELTLQDTPTGNSFYTSVYEDGFTGVMQPIIKDFQDGEFYSGMQNFVIAGTSSVIPRWEMCFNTGLVNLGCGTFTIPAYIFDFIRICFIVMAGFLCRAIVMGG